MENVAIRIPRSPYPCNLVRVLFDIPNTFVAPKDVFRSKPAFWTSRLAPCLQKRRRSWPGRTGTR